MQTIQYFLTILLSATLAFALVSCDGTTSADDVDVSEVPEAPSFDEMQMQTDTFDKTALSVNEIGGANEPGYKIDKQKVGNSLKEALNEVLLFDPVEFPSYEVASAFVSAFEGLHQNNVSLLNAFFTEWAKDEAELSGDEYVWDYSVSDPETGETFSIQVTASVVGQDVNWVVIAEMEGAFEEQQIMEGSTDQDGSTGYWTFTLEIPEDDYSLQSTNTWAFDGERLSDMELDLSIIRGDYHGEASGKYELDDNTGRIYDATIYHPGLESAADDLPWDIDLTDTFHIEWNIETEVGSFTLGEETFCWDENHMPVAC